MTDELVIAGKSRSACLFSQCETPFVSSDGHADLLIFEKHLPYHRDIYLHPDCTEKLEDG